MGGNPPKLEFNAISSKIKIQFFTMLVKIFNFFIFHLLFHQPKFGFCDAISSSLF